MDKTAIRKHWGNLTGVSFGRLTVLGLDPKSTPRRRWWMVHCKCGVEKSIRQEALVSGATKSCNCLRKEYYASGKSALHGHCRHGVWSVEYHLYQTAKQRAKNLGIPFSIEIDDIKVPKLCPVLGIPLIRGSKKQQDNSPTLDRMSPSRGYIKGNIAVISYLANRIKTNANAEQIERVATYARRCEAGIIS
jgi:hypothetical protein